MKKLCSMVLVICMLLGMVVTSHAEPVTEPTLENLGIPAQSFIPDDSEYLLGRSIRDTYYYKGKLFVAIGDYNVNLGGKLGGYIPIYSYTPSTGEWVKEGQAWTEQNIRFHESFGTLYLVDADATGGSAVKAYYYDKTAVEGDRCHKRSCYRKRL